MISGSTICLNAVRRDYCLEACIRSMLGICDEVVVVDGGSDDGTVELVEGIGDERIKLFHEKVEISPGCGWRWLRDWSESARLKCRFEMHLYVQADEVLHQCDFGWIKDRAYRKETLLLRRYNFWFDEHHILPSGHGVCSDNVIRLAPTTVGFHLDGDAESLDGQGARQSTIGLYHYGFIRQQHAFVEKCRLMGAAYRMDDDPIIQRVEEEGMQVLLDRYPLHSLIPFIGTHPKYIQPWLARPNCTEKLLFPTS